MNLIVAVDEAFGIGKGGKLPWHIPADLAYFKRMTLGKTVIMGRRTLESFPGGRPLPKRNNLVLTANPAYEQANVMALYSLEQLLEKVKRLPPDDVFVIGGATVYEQLLPYCARAYVTKVCGRFETDTAFPNLDQLEGWRLTLSQPVQEDNGYEFRFCVYQNSRAKALPQ